MEHVRRELVWKPAVDVREKDGALVVSAAVAGVDPKDINVDITPEDVVIKGKTEHTKTKDEGQVYESEFISGQLFRSLHFPKKVDVAKARAEYKNGLLTVTAPILPVGPPTRLEVGAA